MHSCAVVDKISTNSASRGLSTTAEILACVIYHEAMQAGYTSRMSFSPNCQLYNFTRHVMHHWFRTSHVVMYCRVYRLI